MVQPVWVPRFFFWITTLVACALLAFVGVAPFLPIPTGANGLLVRTLDLFAADSTVRRTGIACGIGLFVTACVFFRCPSKYTRASIRSLPPPVVGA